MSCGFGLSAQHRNKVLPYILHRIVFSKLNIPQQVFTNGVRMDQWPMDHGLRIDTVRDFSECES